MALGHNELLLASESGAKTTLMVSPDILAVLQLLQPLLGQVMQRVELIGQGGPEQGARPFGTLAEDWGFLRAALASFFAGLAGIFNEAPVPAVTSVMDLPAVVVHGFFFILFGRWLGCKSRDHQIIIYYFQGTE